jgi:hypothetical protein
MNKMDFKEQYKNRGRENYQNKKKNRCSKVEKFSINRLNYKFDEYTIKNKDYDPRRTFVRSRLKNKKIGTILKCRICLITNIFI